MLVIEKGQVIERLGYDNAPLSIIETDKSGWWEDLSDWSTTFYRNLNPFVRADGSMIAGTSELANEFTTAYRQINPFVNEQGGGEFFGIQSINDVGIARNFMNYTKQQGWVQSWELMESPFFRVAVPLAISTGISILSAGILIHFAPSLGVLGNLAELQVQGIGRGATVAELFGGFVGSTYGKTLGSIPVNNYILKSKELETNDRIKEYARAEEELKEIERLTDEANRINIETARKKIERERQSIQMVQTAGIVAGVSGTALIIMSLLGGN